MTDNNRAYVLVPDDVPLGYAINGVAHAGCCMALKWGNDPEFKAWARESFRKVTCKIDRLDIPKLDGALVELMPGREHSGPIAQANWLDDNRIIVTESDWNDAGIVAVVYKPRVDWPKAFKKLELYK